MVTSSRNVALLLSLACVIACGGGLPTYPKRGSADPGARKLATAEEQDARDKLVNAYMSLGVIRGVRVVDNVQAEVRVPGDFVRRTEQDKREVLGVVAARAFRVPKSDQLERNECMSIIDDATGEKLGVLDAEGLRWY